MDLGDKYMGRIPLVDVIKGTWCLLAFDNSFPKVIQCNLPYLAPVHERTVDNYTAGIPLRMDMCSVNEALSDRPSAASLLSIQALA
jgi:hypothetical protein